MNHNGRLLPVSSSNGAICNDSFAQPVNNAYLQFLFMPHVAPLHYIWQAQVVGNFTVSINDSTKGDFIPETLSTLLINPANNERVLKYMGQPMQLVARVKPEALDKSLSRVKQKF